MKKSNAEKKSVNVDFYFLITHLEFTLRDWIFNQAVYVTNEEDREAVDCATEIHKDFDRSISKHMSTRQTFDWCKGARMITQGATLKVCKRNLKGGQSKSYLKHLAQS
jgi:hypothetical protein